MNSAQNPTNQIFFIVDEAACEYFTSRTCGWCDHDVTGYMSPNETLKEIAKRGGTISAIYGNFNLPGSGQTRDGYEPKRKRICTTGEGSKPQPLVVMCDKYKEAIICKKPQEPAILHHCVSYQVTGPKDEKNEVSNICEKVIMRQIYKASLNPDLCQGIFLVDNNASGRIVAPEMLHNFQYQVLKEDSAIQFIENKPIIKSEDCIILRYFTVPGFQAKHGDADCDKVPYLCIPSDFMEEFVRSLSPETKLKVFIAKPKNDKEVDYIVTNVLGNEYEMSETVSSMTNLKGKSIVTESAKRSLKCTKNIRMKWSPENRRDFEDAYKEVIASGTEAPTAGHIQKKMKNKSISITQIASYLQKFKVKMKRSTGEGTSTTTINQTSGFNVSETRPFEFLSYYEVDKILSPLDVPNLYTEFGEADW